MANTKATLVFTVLFLFLVSELHVYGKGTLAAEEEIDCGSKCEYRCSKASRHKMCIRACNTCCERCHCVPPGTSGNEDVCPCYANMTTHGGKHKCP
ncbi:cypmaclein-like [Magnolia sinica]|uniref:cypmaclein-like n=1 Tax=Magnolia sinica TaxID=86752 RepID=UPI00265A4FE5|nr:cypmaclein-like [Magnolia sinica]